MPIGGRCVNPGQRAMQGGAEGIKIIVKGRISGAEIARVEKFMLGRVPLHTLRATLTTRWPRHTRQWAGLVSRYGCTGGEILPPPPEEVEELETIEVVVQTGEPDEALLSLEDVDI